MITEDRILDCRGIYVYKNNNKIIIEIFITKTFSNAIFLWQSLPANNDFAKQINKELWTEFCMNNPNNLPATIMNRLWDAFIVNG